MLYNVGGFNAPCREAIYRRVMKLAGESYSRDKFLEYDAVNRKSALKRMNAGSVDRNHFIPLASPVIIDWFSFSVSFWYVVLGNFLYNSY